MVVKGGLIPHARHGGRGVEAFAVAVLKFGGIGLENEQIGQIQVAFAALTGVVPNCERKELVLPTCEEWLPGDEDQAVFTTVGLKPALGVRFGPSFNGFG